MINEIKTIVQNYLNNIKLCSLTSGTVTNEGIKISDRLVIPDELIIGNLKDYTSIGDQVRLLRNHGGQEFFIVEVIGMDMVLNGVTVNIEPITISGQTIESIKIKGVIK